MPETYIAPWQYEQERVDGPVSLSSPPPPVPQAAPEGTVEIPLDAWKQGPPGPIDLGGQGIYMAGRGVTRRPEAMAGWTPAIEAERESIREQRRMEQVMASAPPGQEHQALENAMRLEGVLAFQSAIKSGVPVMQALQRYGPKMYFNSPSAAATLAKLSTPEFSPTMATVGGIPMIQSSRGRWQVAPQSTSTGPIQAQPVMLGSQQVGVAVPGRGGAVHVMPQERPTGARASDLISLARLRLDALDKDIKAARFPVTGKPDEAAISALQAERSSVLQELRSLGATPAASTQKKAPAVGTIVRGYRFKGGDPSQRSSWEKVE